MREIWRGVALSTLLALGCGGGEAETIEAEETTGEEVEAEPTTQAELPAAVARFQGSLAGAIEMVIELDASGGGRVRYPSNGRIQGLSSCQAAGQTLTCRVDGEGFAGDLEMTHREERSGVEGRMRSDSDGVWTDFSADTVAPD